MVTRLDIPFNLSLLVLDEKKLQSMKPVRVLDSFDASGTNFHEDGLFSVSIFGRVGDDMRSLKFSYIDIKVEILHPIVFRTLADLKQLYKGIMAGTDYAVFDKDENDFVRSDAVNGKTGYAFFIAHWTKIQYPATKSVSREHNIKLINTYMRTALRSKIPVIPAALRDMEIGNDGRHEEGEINTLYRRLIAISNTISGASINQNIESINTARYALQTTTNDIFAMLEDMVAGRRKLIQNRWTSRRIFNGTRNVITAMDTSVAVLGAPGNIGFNNTGIGLFQMLKAVLPISRYLIRNGFLSKVFTGANQPAKLVNAKTWKSEDVMLKPMYFDRYMTDEGVEKLISAFSSEDVRHEPLMIDGHYLGLIYKGPDKTFRLMQDIDELPVAGMKEYVTPLTFVELLYCSTFFNLNKYPLLLTRYPITGMGSIVPSFAYVKTTVKSEVRTMLGDNWAALGPDFVAYQFPVAGSAFINSLIPHSSKLDRLDADFDGDTGSGNALYTDEAIKEVKGFMSSRRAYLDVNGNFLASTSTSTIELALHNLTGD